MNINQSNALTLGKIVLKSPLLTCSGTSGSAGELYKLSNSSQIFSSLGAFVTKGVTLLPRDGNPAPRIVEERKSLLNAIGLQNSGALHFCNQELPTLKGYNLPILVNISGGNPDEFGELTRILIENDKENLISGFEVNVSCPNIKEGGKAFGTNPKMTQEVVESVKKHCAGRTIVTKLTPNLDDITEVARAAIAAGSDALSMINTLRGMAIDVNKKRPILGNITGGLSGPAVKPVGLFMVFQCFKNIPECRSKQVPIIGIGGVANGVDAAEYILAGATAVGIGTEFFVNHNVFENSYVYLENWREKQGMSYQELIGVATR